MTTDRELHPTPWHLEKCDTGEDDYQLIDANGRAVAGCGPYDPPVVSRADGERIVRLVNAEAEVAEALTTTRDCLATLRAAGHGLSANGRAIVSAQVANIDHALALLEVEPTLDPPLCGGCDAGLSVDECGMHQDHMGQFPCAREAEPKGGGE